MAYTIIKENNRSAGAALSSLATSGIVGGQPLLYDSVGAVMPYGTSSTGGVTIYPSGVAADTTIEFPIAPTTGLTAGQGYDYTNFARGGLVGQFILGSILQLYNDGRGALWNTADTWAINGPVYASTTVPGQYTTAVDSPIVGSVVTFDVAVNPTYLQVKFLI